MQATSIDHQHRHVPSLPTHAPTLPPPTAGEVHPSPKPTQHPPAQLCRHPLGLGPAPHIQARQLRLQQRHAVLRLPLLCNRGRARLAG